MGGDRFWYLFGGIWLFVGVIFVATSLGIDLSAKPEQLNGGPPLWVFAAVGVACSAGGCAVIYFAFRAAARDRRLMQSGVPLTATVIDIERSMFEINRQTRWNVRYRYTDAMGRSFEGKSRGLRGDSVWRFKPGDKVQIMVDRTNPAESVFVDTA